MEYDLKVSKIVQAETLDSQGSKKSVTKIFLNYQRGTMKIQVNIQTPTEFLQDFLQDLELFLDDIVTLELSKKQSKLVDFEG